MSRPATGKKPSLWYVVSARVQPVSATSAAAACLKVESRKGGALAGSSFVLRTATEADALLSAIGNIGNKGNEVRV